MKQAVILAAGRGLRLGSPSNGQPKCLLEVGGKTLVEHQLDVLHGAGIENIAIVVGYRADLVRSVAGEDCCYITNQRYAETNSLYSLWLAREWISGAFVLTNGDVLAHPEIYRRVMAVDGTSLAFDSSSGDDREHMKVSFSNGRLRSISKDVPADQTQGENVGILKFERSAAELLLDEASALIAADSPMSWAPAAVGQIADRVPISGVDVAGMPWIEIDFPDDLAFARENIWPAMSEKSDLLTRKLA